MPGIGVDSREYSEGCYEQEYDVCGIHDERLVNSVQRQVLKLTIIYGLNKQN